MKKGCDVKRSLASGAILLVGAVGAVIRANLNSGGSLSIIRDHGSIVGSDIEPPYLSVNISPPISI